MKRKSFLIAGLVIILASLFSPLLVKAGNSGAIWTTRADCGDIQQDVNHYSNGETVFINGANFDPGDYQWEIKGQPGNASSDPNEVVASGTYTVDITGAFCFAAYVVGSDDGYDSGEYKVTFGNKGDNYHVEYTPPKPTKTQKPPTPPVSTPTATLSPTSGPTPTSTSVPPIPSSTSVPPPTTPPNTGVSDFNSIALGFTLMVGGIVLGLFVMSLSKVPKKN